jgi:hypothetical protein
VIYAAAASSAEARLQLDTLRQALLDRGVPDACIVEYADIDPSMHEVSGMPREHFFPGRPKRVREYLVDPALKERAERPMLPRLLEEARRHYFEVLVVVFPWCLHRDSQVRSQIRKRLQGPRIDLVILRNEK